MPVQRSGCGVDDCGAGLWVQRRGQATTVARTGQVLRQGGTSYEQAFVPGQAQLVHSGGTLVRAMGAIGPDLSAGAPLTWWGGGKLYFGAGAGVGSRRLSPTPRIVLPALAPPAPASKR